MEIWEQIKSIPSTRRDLRNFGLTVGIVLLLIGAALWYFDKTSFRYFLIIGAALAVTGLILPKILLPLQKVWMALAVVLSWIVTRIILAIMFYIVFTLVRVISTLLGKPFIERKWDRAAPTYWNVRERTEFDKTKAEKQY
jgi:hypothetical protein